MIETNQEIPSNRMHWKFYELPKFAKKYKKGEIDQRSSLKEQWLDFLLKCSKHTEIPDNINNIIKKGYKIMEIANWSEEQKILYWKQKYTEELEVKEQARLIEEAKTEGKIEGKIEGEIKGEIKLIIQTIKYKIPLESLIDDLEYIKNDNFYKLVSYINQGHEKDNVEQIIKSLGLLESIINKEVEEIFETDVSGDTSSELE